MEEKLRKLRRDYQGGPLNEQDVAADPLEQFRRWFGEVVSAGVDMADAFALATVDGDGRPSVRMVLLKGLGQGGFEFFTNYDSRKAHELDANPRASMCFWWQAVARQVRVDGQVTRMTAAESDAYFATRPREANVGALASPQSRPLSDRAELERRVEQVRREWEGRDLVRPAGWGGYRLQPDAVELWQGRADRLHDRLLYVREGASWRLMRLAP